MKEKPTSGKDATERGPIHLSFVVSTLGTGGSEMMVRELVLRLDRSRFVPSVVCLGDRGPVGDQIHSRGVTVLDHVARFRFDPFSLLKVRRAFRILKTDVIVCLDHRNAIILGVLASLGVARRRLIAVHSTRLWPGKGVLRGPVRWVLIFVHRIIAVGRNQAAYLSDEEGVPREKVAIVPNGIELLEFGVTADLDAIRQSLGISRGQCVVGIVASLRPEKNHELFLKAASMVAGAIPKARFVIVGGGARRKGLEALAAGLRIQESVHFLGERTDARLLIRGFDVAVLCSHPVVETLPIFLMEAMACGKAVVATKVGDIDSLVEEGVTGFLVPPGSSEELSKAIIRLLENDQLRAEMGEMGRDKIEREFSLSNSVRTFENLVKEELNRS